MWAQLPTATDTQILTGFAIACVALVGSYYATGVYLNLKKIRRPEPTEEQYVVKAELTKELTALKQSISECAVKEDVVTIQSDLKELDDYTHDGFHKMASDLQTITNQIGVMAAHQEGLKEQFGMLVPKFDKSYELLVRLDAAQNPRRINDEARHA